MQGASSETRGMREIERFLQALKGERNASPHTLAAYRNDLETFARFLGRDPSPGGWPAVDRTRVRAFLADQGARGASRATLARRLSALRSFFRFLCREGVVRSNPARYVTRARRGRPCAPAAPCVPFDPCPGR